MSPLIGKAVPRKEDANLLTGRGTFVDDLKPPGLVHMAYVRSVEPHARLVGVDTEEARGMPGVLGVWTAEDLPDLPPMRSAEGFPRPCLAVGRVRWVGEPVAVVVATDRYTAADAAQAVRVDYDPLPVVASVETALAEGAQTLFEQLDSNVVLEQPMSADDAEAELAAAPHRRSMRLVNQRCAPVPIEPYGVVADWTAAGLTLWGTLQAPHHIRGELCEKLGLARQQVRVIAPDVGGGFGSKATFYPELLLVPELSRRLRRPVKYVETRSEHMLHTTHGRDQIQDVEVGYDDDGRILALRALITQNVGGIPDMTGIGVASLTVFMLSGCYRIPKISATFRSVVTNTTPVACYRGCGRPEASFLIERVVDTIAHDLGRDPAEVRRANFIPPEAMPYATQFEGIVYDEADYPATLDVLLGHLDYEALRKEQAARRGNGGPLLGIGLSTFVEMAGFGPTPLFEQFGYLGGWESAVIRIQPDGSAIISVGASPHGQGTETSLAQIAADTLGVRFDRISVVHGDTAVVQEGIGTMGSRTIAVAGNAVQNAAVAVVDKARTIAAHMLEADSGDLDFAGGVFRVRGTDSEVSLGEVATRSFKPHLLPEGHDIGLEATKYFEPANLTYCSGAHACVVELDQDTGAVSILRYLAVDDCGNVINPLLARGQVHGGVAQGIAQALYEKVEYSAEGQPLTSTLIDYLVPGAPDLPSYETHHFVTPTSFNPLGAKGLGESGATGAPQAVVNAVVDALAHLGVRDIEMPCTPERVWNAINGGPGQ